MTDIKIDDERMAKIYAKLSEEMVENMRKQMPRHHEDLSNAPKHIKSIERSLASAKFRLKCLEMIIVHERAKQMKEVEE